MWTGPLALDPEDRVAELLGHLDRLEADQLPELDDALALAGRDLDRDVLEHGSKLRGFRRRSLAKKWVIFGW